jgi:hypothetical protein
VNPTILGSKSAGPLAAAWAITEALGTAGFAELAESCLRSTRALREAIDDIEGLRVVGDPVGPLLAVAADEGVAAERRVDPHHWADAARSLGWVLQLQPGLAQSDGTVLPPTTHLTITPVTEAGLPELVPALIAAADAVRGVPHVDPSAALAGLPPLDGGLDSATAWALLQGFGIGVPTGSTTGALPDQLAPLLALIEVLPQPIAERLLTELIARLVEPR